MIVPVKMLPGTFELMLTLKPIDSPKEDGFLPDRTVVVVGALLTTCVTEPLLGWKLALPLYSAVIAWLPILRLEVLKLAWGPVREFNAIGPARITLPSLKVMLAPCTGPAGPVAPAPGATEAEKVTCWPKLEGFSDEIIVVDVVVRGLFASGLHLPAVPALEMAWISV